MRNEIEEQTLFKSKLEKSLLVARKLWPWIVAIAAVLSSNLVANTIWDIFESDVKKEYAGITSSRIFYFLFFVLMVYLLYRQRNVFSRPYTRRIVGKDAGQRKHLVLFLSNLKKELEEIGGIPEKITLSNNINNDIKNIESLKQGKPSVFWTWEMPLRAIRHHLGRLESVTLICSRESIRQASLFVSICKKYDNFNDLGFFLFSGREDRDGLLPLTDSLDIRDYKGFNFENFDELSTAMWDLINEFKKKGYPEKEIMIDITGGQKPTSITGAAITFNREIEAQYVQTNTPWEVRGYDVWLVSPDTGGYGL